MNLEKVKRTGMCHKILSGQIKGMCSYIKNTQIFLFGMLYYNKNLMVESRI